MRASSVGPSNSNSAANLNPEPLIPLAPHERDIHKRFGFRMLVALIMLFSLGNIMFAISLSLLYDIDWAYYGVLASLAFSIAEVMLWALVMVLWASFRWPWDLGTEEQHRRVFILEMIFAWIFFFAMLAACGIFM